MGPQAALLGTASVQAGVSNILCLFRIEKDTKDTKARGYVSFVPLVSFVFDRRCDLSATPKRESRWPAFHYEWQRVHAAEPPSPPNTPRTREIAASSVVSSACAKQN
jgi:hypothetical protein